MSRAVSAQTAKIIGLSGSRAADQRSAGLKPAAAARLARLVADAGVGVAADPAPRAPRRQASRSPASEPSRAAMLGKAKSRPNVTAMLELGAGVLRLTEVCGAYEAALRAAGDGKVPIFDEATVEAGEAFLALLRRYGAKR